MTIQIWIGILLAILLTVFIVACSGPIVISALEAAIAAAEVAVPIIGQETGLPPATSAMIVTYLQAVSTATGQASVILASAVTPAQKAAQIIAAFEKAAQGLNLPPGTPSTIVAVISTVTDAVATFLANFKGTPPASTGKLKTGDYQKLAALKARSDGVLKLTREGTLGGTKK